MLSDETDTLEDCIKKQCRCYITASLRFPEDFQFVTQYHMAPVIDKRNLQSPDLDFKLPGHPLSFYIRERVLKPLSPIAISYILLGILNQMIAAHHAGFLVMDEPTIQSVLDACWDAIRS